MKSHIKSVVLIYSIALLFCSLFIMSSAGSVKSSSSEDFFKENGMVLGVSEVATGKIRAGVGYTASFPESKTILDNENQIVVPSKKTDFSDISFPDYGSAIVIDNDSDEVLFSKDEKSVLPLASITKLVTALVFLDNNPGWDTVYEVKSDDRVNGGKVYLYRGDKVKVRDLFYLSLVGSANTATKALVRSTGLTEEEFILKMNEKAIKLGLKQTSFVDPIGLGYYNVSNVMDTAILIRTAMSNKAISEASLTKEYRFKTEQGKDKVVYSTDQLLDVFPHNGIRIMGGKTGYTVSAGYCFTGVFINPEGKILISVVLGMRSPNERFSATKKMIEWAYENYEWKKI